MNRRQYLAGTGVALTAAAGCAAPAESTPTDGGQHVPVTFSNESGRTVVFTVAAVEAGLGGVRISYRDGSERTLGDAETVADVPAEAWEGAVTFTPLADAPRRQFRSTDGSGTGIDFGPLRIGSTVVTTVADPNRADSMLSVGAGACGNAETAEIGVRVDAAGLVHHRTTCGGEAEVED